MSHSYNSMPQKHPILSARLPPKLVTLGLLLLGSVESGSGSLARRALRMTRYSRPVLVLHLMCAAVASAGAQDSTLAARPALSSARAVLACARRVVDAAGFRVEPIVEPRKVGFRAFKLGSGSTSYQEGDCLGVW